MQHMLHPNTNLKLYHQTAPLVQERARGIYLWDNQGNQYLEGLAGLWGTALGYGEEELIRVAQDQLRKMSFGPTFVGKTNEPSVLLAEKLKAMAPFDAGRVFCGVIVPPEDYFPRIQEVLDKYGIMLIDELIGKLETALDETLAQVSDDVVS